MRPLKITAFLSSPLAGDAPMLDSLMCYKVSKYRHHQMPEGKSMPCPKYPAIPIPLKEINGWQIPRCSNPIVEPVEEAVEFVGKRFGIEYSHLLLESERKAVKIGGGALKSYRIPIRTRMTTRVVWFAMGTAHVVRPFLRQFTSLGTKRSIGMGVVLRWDVDIVEHDFSWFANDVLMRVLPTGKKLIQVAGARPDYRGVVWPYWHPDRFAECLHPI